MYVEKINNKDNLLITIGDSWTEGVGCYDPELLPSYLKGEIGMEILYPRSQDKGFFKDGSWPVRLSEMLDCDLINLGNGGDANSAAAKYLIQEYHEVISEKAKQYKKINVIWLLSIPERFSFYSNKRIRSFRHDAPEKLTKLYYTDVCRDPADALLETAFYLRTVDWYCKANNFNFAYGSAFTDITPLNDVINIKVSNIHQYIPFPCISQYLDHRDEKYWAPCRHPNNAGYAKIAEHLFEIINYYFNEMT